MPEPAGATGPHIAIVGGGTAGWLAALMIRHYAGQTGLNLRVTVVESSRIPTIGVGEGTTAVFYQLLRTLGIDEATFLRETGATLKLGIRHRDWRHTGHSYDGPIDDPHPLIRTPGFESQTHGPILDIYATARDLDPAECRLFGHLLRRNRSPYARKRDGTLIPAGPFQHAYHFDQALVGAFLRSTARNIVHIDATVDGAERDAATGNIRCLHLADAPDLAADFFIDCTGFRRKLIGETMGSRWVSYADSLPVNRAMPFWLDHDGASDIPIHTLAWAQKAGWMWQIPTQERMGCGYVYSDAHLSPDQAQAEIEAALGHPITPRNDLRFDIGRLDRVWVGNCLALGLASSFLEPLEATSIHGTVVQLMLFTQGFLDGAWQADDTQRDRYNAAAARQLDDFRTFINLHYVGERPEPFWQAVRATGLHETTRARLEAWRNHAPRRSDFAPFPGNLPHVEEQLYYPVLAGLGLLSKKAADRELAADPALRSHARKSHGALARDYRRVAGQCLSHRDYLGHAG